MENKEAVKQQKNSDSKEQKEPKKTGFQLFPENINRNGRPPKSWSWAELLEDVGEEIEEKTGKKFKHLVSKRLWFECINGNVGAIKELFNRMEGMPKQSTDITSKGEKIDSLYGLLNSDDKSNNKA